MEETKFESRKRVITNRRLVWDGETKFTLTEEKTRGGFVLDSKKVEIQLEPISLQGLIKKRNSGKPGLVLKKNNKLYYSQIDSKIRLSSLAELRQHKCRDCYRLSAKPEELGGCKKVRDIEMRLEKYDFIKLGIETFNFTERMLLVLECTKGKAYREIDLD